jgi:predicted metal-binding protein
MSTNIDPQDLVLRACELGASEAKIIDARSIVVAAWVRMKCQFGCGGYNKGLCCPPHSPTPEQTRAVIDCYTRALLIHCQGEVRPSPLISQLERAFFLGGYYKALGLGEGPCRLCKTCNLARCEHPSEARPSMEACGIDVFATVRANGFPIRVVQNRQDERNFYGLVLFE